MNLRVAIGEAGPSPAKAWLRALEMTAPIAAHPARTLPAIIDDLAEAHGDAPALLSDCETLSYRGLAARANRYARWALAQGLAKGDTVGLLMPNRPPAPHAVAAGRAGPPSRWLPRRKAGSIESATSIEYKFIRTEMQILSTS